MKIVILCPHGVRTGGPEALHQLSDSLHAAGHDARFWYVEQIDFDLISRMSTIQDVVSLTPRDCVFDEYRHYKIHIFNEYNPNDQLVFVLPEVMAHLIPMLQRHKVLMWWLSLDYASASIGQINFNFLRAPYVAHAAQSHYAMGGCSALGLSPQLLTDYTVTPIIPSAALDVRPPRIALNANNKVIIDINYVERSLQDAVTGVEIIRVVNMDRRKIYETFATSRLFIDLGSFTGKDRMPREALQLGCNLIVGRSGAGAHYEDYPLPEVYRPSPFDLGGVVDLAKRMVSEPAHFAPDFEAMRRDVAGERTRFNEEVVRVFAPYR